MTFIKACDRIIEYCFYGLFLLVPLAFTSATSELFEMNKMWLTWALTIIIAMAWFTKMILQRRILLRRTPLDIPIALFLFSQIISTIFSLDFHVSLWGYYSRFNGGLFSIIAYIFLYYAFLSNSPTLGKVQRLLTISLISGLIVALWGFPSHFGYDPTCLLFRGTLDVSCWTADFMPKVRIFSTLGQPDWLAAYLAILIPIATAYAMKTIRDKKQEIGRGRLLVICYLLLIALFYIDLLYTRARSGFLGVGISLTFFFVAYIWIKIRDKKQTIGRNLLLIPCILLLITFVIGVPINQLRILTLDGVRDTFKKMQVQNPPNKPNTDKKAATEQVPTQPHDPGGTESGYIRLLVWEGALNAWKNNPIFGTGVETFAFAYYKFKPAAHNLTSEWNFLYNKAHNEYLNFLATTGLFGLGTYLAMIIVFLYLAIKQISNFKFLISNQIPNSKSQLGELPARNASQSEAGGEIRSIRNLTLALLASYISILITNFFGFSVVITNIYLFMIPAFVFVLADMIKPNLSAKSAQKFPARNASASVAGGGQIESSIWQWTPIFFVLLIGFFILISLFRFWRADISFALGYNLDRAGEYQNAYPYLQKAVQLRGDEPVFRDELSINDAIIAAGLMNQTQSDNLDQKTKDKAIAVASTLAQEAINTSNEVITKHTNNAVFWKTRVRLFFTLAQVDSRYLHRALDAIEKAALIAPNDANISYNLGILYGQNKNTKKGIEVLENTIKLKPNYKDAYYALGLFYHQEASNSSAEGGIDSTLQKKAIDQMQYILKNISPKDPGALESIKNWQTN